MSRGAPAERSAPTYEQKLYKVEVLLLPSFAACLYLLQGGPPPSSLLFLPAPPFSEITPPPLHRMNL